MVVMRAVSAVRVSDGPASILRAPVLDCAGRCIGIETGRGVDVRARLEGLGLETYAGAFADNDIDGAM